MNLEELLNYRRSVRVYDPEKDIDTQKVKHCLELATLAPNSSNMQLWEFYHITQEDLKEKVSKVCLNQSATRTAKEIVVFVTRQDLHRKRAKYVLEFERDNIKNYSPVARQLKRIKDREVYYGKIMPFLYARFYGILGAIRVLITSTVGLFKPIVREVSESDIRAVAHKSCALAAQTFMLAMAEQGYDTCPIEGFDSRRMKNLLNLPSGAEINMAISCGIRKGDDGIWGERCRVPFEEVYHRK